MLPSSYRLPSREFPSLLKRAKRLHKPELSLLYNKNNNDTPRFGFVASSKVDTRAAVRNRIKRLLREATKCIKDKITRGYDCVWVARPGIQGLSQKDIEDKVIALLCRAKIINSSPHA